MRTCSFLAQTLLAFRSYPTSACIRHSTTSDPAMARVYLEAPWARPPQSPSYAQLRPGNAAVQWACGRRGRLAILTVLLCIVVFFMAIARQSDVSIPSSSPASLINSPRATLLKYPVLTLLWRHFLHPTVPSRRATTKSLPGGRSCHIFRHLYQHLFVNRRAPPSSWRMALLPTRQLSCTRCHLTSIWSCQLSSTTATSARLPCLP